MLKQRKSKDNLFYFFYFLLLQYTTEDLLSLIQASEEEILHHLQVIDACKIEGIILKNIIAYEEPTLLFFPEYVSPFSKAHFTSSSFKVQVTSKHRGLLP